MDTTNLKRYSNIKFRLTKDSAKNQSVLKDLSKKTLEIPLMHRVTMESKMTTSKYKRRIRADVELNGFSKIV